MRKIAKYMLLALVPTALPLVYLTEAHAIPAFSREHNTECTTCHTIYPELNEYGEAFAKNGFVWTKNIVQKEKAAPAPVAKPDVQGEGDPELLSKLKENVLSEAQPADVELEQKSPRQNEPLWLSGLPEKLPLSISANLNAAYNENATDKDKLDLSTRALSLLGGGVIRDKISFFVKYNLYTQGPFNPAASNVPPNNTPDVEELYVMWRKALNSPVNLKVGRFRPKLSLWKKNNKTSISDFATTSYTVGSSLFSVDATEDAVEANALIGSRVFVAGGIVDRNGQNTKEGYGHISFKVGGSDFRGKEPEVDFDNESIWDYLSITVAAYGYSGRNSGDFSTQRNNFYRVGGDLDMLYKSLRVRFSGVTGKDKNPDFASHIGTDSEVYAGQAEYMFAVNMLGLVRYEHQKIDNQITRRVIPAIAYAPIENTKVTLEYQYVNGVDVSHQTLLGLRIAF